MVERRPAGFNVDLNFADSKEVMSIPARQRNAAVGLWVRCGAWSANKLTDGYIPAEILKSLGATRALVDALIASTLWLPADGGGIWFTNWTRWQRTRSEVKAYRESEAERKRLARAAAKQASTSGESEASARTSAGPTQSVRPDSRAPKAKGESLSVVTSGGESTLVDARPPGAPPRYCPKHPNGTPDKCGGCRDARIRFEQWEAVETTKRVAEQQRNRDRIRDQRANCPLCDGTGMVPVDPTDDDSPLEKCVCWE